MIINYLILAHKDPKQLKRLITRLSSTNCFFYIHIDRNADIAVFYKEIPATAFVCYVPDEKREFSNWGGIGLVRASISLLGMSTKSYEPAYCILMSGQDYPLKNNAYIKTFLETNYGKEYINHFAIPSYKWPDKGMDRLTNYKIDFSGKRGDFILYPSIFQKKFYSFSNIRNLKKLFSHAKYSELLLLLRKRKFPADLAPYGGSMWWALTIETSKNICKYIGDNPGYLYYHRHTLVPDEIFFTSIVLDLFKNHKPQICETITYVDWERKNVPLPVTFTKADFSLLRSLPDNLLFARKFDAETDEMILNQLDRFVV